MPQKQKQLTDEERWRRRYALLKAKRILEVEDAATPGVIQVIEAKLKQYEKKATPL